MASKNLYACPCVTLTFDIWPWIHNLSNAVSVCGQFWFKSIERFTSYQVHKISTVIAVWPWPLTYDLENLITSSPKCSKYLYKFGSKSLQRYRMYRVHNIVCELCHNCRLSFFQFPCNISNSHSHITPCYVNSYGKMRFPDSHSLCTADF